ncbi:MAG: glycosyltransferase N-terminal domain-containing protein [Gemmatimonadaceae bacterium]|nr:glycosyltransferase N-terminal domain-containing protein [Gemmatimonadaceae bacterium]
MARYRRFSHEHRDRTRPLVWFHAPSVGEGLQATPVMSRLRAQRADVQQAYTHFSPSAATFAAKTGADFHDYLPFDTASAMQAAIEALQPTALVFSKLDVWPVLVEQALRRRVPVGMISATVAEGSARRSGLAAAVSRDAFAALQAVGAIDDADADRLVEIGVRTRSASPATRGTTRSGHARSCASNAPSARSDSVAVPRLTLVAGSTWPSDDAVLLPAWHELTTMFPGMLRLIIAPHEPTPSHLQPINAWASNAQLHCVRLDATDDAMADVVLVDRVGVLGDLYALADTAFVGGGFHAAGLHSVLEPAAFGAPVIFGPRFTNSRDAELLRHDGGGCSVRDRAELLAALTTWLSPTEANARRAAGEKARQRVERGLGAADRATELVLSLLQR